ncbi:putative bifunctional diguanylate cyclase/phosphodiesterase [Rhizobium halophilum]|uniref:putative bifunctional diguanylate cyclase/phosphodiesterase n=1 Tax=Rhizobium halophilum TaxID=2846852 RepID=UPI001EFE03AB|nr:EAL domain-containing protein [Rhizobium halophilum]MCF6367829.1 EAL domain-containing protein [Rhizobium halophilum]
MMGRQATLPTDVYLSFVSSLFGNRGTLVTGVVVHVVWCVIVFSYTGSWFYLYAGAGFPLVFALRYADFLRFDRVDKASLTDRDISRWERRYVIGATLLALLLGTTSGHAMLVLKDSFVAFTCIAMTMGSMMSIVGRNYGSRHAVNFQTLGCCVPIILACVASGDLHLAMMSLLLIPFGLTTRSMANGVREFLYENVLATRKNRLIANQLDLALTTIAHGLIMLDHEGRIEVVNRRACDLLGLPEASEIQGLSLVGVLDAHGSYRPTKVVCEVKKLVSGSLDRTVFQLRAELHVEFSASRREDGGVVLIFEDVTARVAADEKILHMVQYDTLTGLANRAHFAALAAAELHQRPAQTLAALVVLDLEGFKHVNDLRGHVVGDRLLMAVASRLSAQFGRDILAGRLVGDEFTLFLLAQDRSELEARVQQVHREIQQAYELPDLRISISANAGCVVAPADTFDMESWLVRADLALRDAQAKGNGSLSLFRPEMDARYVEEQKLRADLRVAVAERRLAVVYQPMYVADGSKIECMEALVRWRHPEKGMIPPNVFIPMAEEMGIISQITAFVLERACEECSGWARPVAVSVNLSVYDLLDPELVVTVSATLSRLALPPARLHLEVTESSFIDDPVSVGRVLHQLREKGITIAVDDFGTGFSSLSYLTSLPLDLVKLDRAFVRDLTLEPKRIKLLRGIAQMSRDLGLRVVIEGVETAEQLQLINDNHFADLVQGYLFSPPVDPHVAAAMVQTARRVPASRGSRKRVKPNS